MNQRKSREMEHNNTKLEGSRDAHTQDSDLAVGDAPAMKAFHQAFADITAECEEKGFRLPNSTDFGFGWRKADEFYQTRLAAEVERREAAENAVLNILNACVGFLRDLQVATGEPLDSQIAELTAISDQVRQQIEGEGLQENNQDGK